MEVVYKEQPCFWQLRNFSALTNAFVRGGTRTGTRWNIFSFNWEGYFGVYVLERLMIDKIILSKELRQREGNSSAKRNFKPSSR